MPPVTGLIGEKKDHLSLEDTYRAASRVDLLVRWLEQKCGTPKRKSEMLRLSRVSGISFLDGFSRQHEGWLANLEVATVGGILMEVRNRRLRGVSIDHPHGKQPHHGYSSAEAREEIFSEFRSMVKALHAAGIEVILDAGNTLKIAR